jgi:hypothetical protein
MFRANMYTITHLPKCEPAELGVDILLLSLLLLAWHPKAFELLGKNLVDT